MSFDAALPSGPDGDFLEQDIKLVRKGRAVVSQRLVLDSGVLRVFDSEESGTFVRFRKSTSDSSIIFLCLHEIGAASSASKQQKICCSAKIRINFDPQNKG